MSGGGGGGGQPTSSTVTQTNIPEYARPYVESMLGATMGNLFRTKDVPAVEAKAAVVDDQGNVVTPAVEAKPAFKEFVDFKEFQPYSKNAADYFAVFSPEQQGVFSETARLGRPVGYDAARTMAGQAGQGGISSAAAAYGYGGEGAQFGRMGAGLGRGALGYGEAGADIGQQGAEMAGMGFGAGKRYEQMATDPRAMQSYMSPYMRNVIDTQKQSAIRDYQENVAPQLAAQATQAGAFGGTRDAVQRALGKRSLTQQLQNIEATGTQKAFEDAQRSQQFGAQLGLQGLGAGYEGLRTGMAGQQLGMQGIQGALAGTAQGMQGAGMGLQGVSGAQAGYNLAGQQGANLANIAGQELTSDISRLGFQGKTAAEKQSRDQAIINQEIQNFAQTQEYPRQSLSFMNAMLRGLPMQATTTQSYLPAVNPYSQILGTGAQLYGMGRMAGAFKEGGQVKHYKEGGITSIDQKVINDPTSFSSDMINKGIKSGSISKMAGAIGLSAIENAQNQAKQQQGLTQGAPQGTILGDLQANASGIDTLPSGLPPQGMAGGGIIAFSPGGLNEAVDEAEAQADKLDRPGIDALIREAIARREAIGLGEGEQEYRKFLKERKEGLTKERDLDRAAAIAKFGAKLSQTRGPFLSALGAGTEAAIPDFMAAEKAYRTGTAEAMKGVADIDRAARGEKLKGVEVGEAAFGRLQDIASREEIARLGREAQLEVTRNPQDLVIAKAIQQPNESLNAAINRLMKLKQTDEKTYNATAALYGRFFENTNELIKEASKPGGHLSILSNAASGRPEALDIARNRYPDIKTAADAKEKYKEELKNYYTQANSQFMEMTGIDPSQLGRSSGFGVRGPRPPGSTPGGTVDTSNPLLK